MKYLSILFLVSVLVSCNSSSNKNIATESTSESSTESEYDQVTSSGLQYTMVQNGDGPKVENGKQITTHCILTLEDGTLIWSSRDDNQEYVFVQGVTSHVAGFEEALSYMKEGDRINVFIPSNLGYGVNGRNPIPPNANLIFDIEVLKVTDREDL